jgi:hypothetical protein
MSILKSSKISIATFIEYEYDDNGDWGQYYDIESQYVSIINKVSIKTLPTILEQEFVDPKPIVAQNPKPIVAQNPKPIVAQNQNQLVAQMLEKYNFLNKNKKNESEQLDKRLHIIGIFCIVTITTLLFS